MLKRISVKQLTVGMHLKKFEGSWLDHPFWRSGFVITDPKDIAAVLASPIKEVWIDVSKGLDVAPEESPAVPAKPDVQRETPAWKAAWQGKPVVRDESSAFKARPVVPGQNSDPQAVPGVRSETPAWKAAWQDKPVTQDKSPALEAGLVVPGQSTDPQAVPGVRSETPAWKAAWQDKPVAQDKSPAMEARPVAPGASTASPAKLVIRNDPAALTASPVAPVKDEPMPPVVQARQTEPTSMAAEVKRAGQICAQSKQAIVSMFREARMGNTVDTANVQLLVEEISDSIARNPGALISLARLKTADDYTYMHSVAVCALMVALARQLALDEAQTRAAGVAGLLHDLGKAMIPLEILNKPGKLTDAEFTIVKRHPVEGHQLLLAGSDVGEVAFDVVLHHHEKMDGSGYPKGLKADEISLFAKMGAVCDVYDAVSSNRPYKAGWDPSEALRRMAEWTKGHFDPRIFQAFVKSLGIYPIGSLVRLTSGRLGVVTEQTGQSLVSPKVKVFFSTKSNMRIVPEIIDLARPGCQEKIAGREDPAEWRFPDLNELWSGLAASPW